LSTTVTETKPGAPGKLGALLRLAAVGCIVLGMVALVRFTPLSELLDPAALREQIARLGPVAPVAFIVGGGLAVAMWIPGTVPTVLGPMLFGTYMALPLNYLVALCGAALGFWIARLIGGDAMNRLLGGRFRLYDRYRHLLEQRGFETMLYLRLVPTPFAGVSYLAGLSPIRFSHYMLATMLGILPMSFIVTLGAGFVIESVMQGDLGPLLSAQGLLVLVLVALATQIPRLLRYGRRRWGWFASADVATLEEPAPVAEVAPGG
jgi:uncharacterized membrane protein YdjX (TVP38/TMEM64 family)